MGNQNVVQAGQEPPHEEQRGDHGHRCDVGFRRSIRACDFPCRLIRHLPVISPGLHTSELSPDHAEPAVHGSVPPKPRMRPYSYTEIPRTQKFPLTKTTM